MVVRRHEAGPFVLSTNLRLQETADHPCRERRCGQGLVRPADQPRAAPLKEGESYQQTQQFALAQRVTRYGASNVQIGCSLRSELEWTWVGGMSSPPLNKTCNRAGLFKRPVRSSASSRWPQTLVQNRKQLRVKSFVLAAWPSCRGPRQPAANELGGGPVRHARPTELVRLAGPSAPRYDTPLLRADLTPRISQRAEKWWCVRLSRCTSLARSRWLWAAPRFLVHLKWEITQRIYILTGVRTFLCGLIPFLSQAALNSFGVA
jgi:hypothetical protein